MADLPTIILGVQQEIRADNRDADRNNDQDKEYEHHETIDVVDLVCPERGEYEIPKTT